jgi:hypothetical protein
LLLEGFKVVYVTKNTPRKREGSPTCICILSLYS